MKREPFRLVCPACRGALLECGSGLRCESCRAEYEDENGFPNLIVGSRFEDPPDADRTTYEVRSNEHTAQHYFVPLFRRLFPSPARPPRLLSLGCGTGADVDVLNKAGFEIAGVDCGNRTSVWPSRGSRDSLYLANGRNLPFENGAFDLVYCGCVFPHLGTDGDSDRVAPGFGEVRLAVAREMARVVRPGGYIVASSPNRHCPLDLFHGRSKQQPYPRLNHPSSPFLLSAGDYRALFAKAGCGSFQLLPVAGYWGFVNRKASWKGRLVALPVEVVFQLVSCRALAFARGAPFSPWLVMLARKAEGWS